MCMHTRYEKYLNIHNWCPTGAKVYYLQLIWCSGYFGCTRTQERVAGHLRIGTCSPCARFSKATYDRKCGSNSNMWCMEIICMWAHHQAIRCWNNIHVCFGAAQMHSHKKIIICAYDHIICVPLWEPFRPRTRTHEWYCSRMVMCARAHKQRANPRIPIRLWTEK